MRSLVIGSTAAVACALSLASPSLGAGYVVMDLHNPPYANSVVYGSVSGQQGGFVYTTEGDPSDPFPDAHAAIWSDSAASFLDLHPTGLGKSSQIYATSGANQVGSVFHFDGTSRAALWSSTAAFVDQTPATAYQAFANAVSGSRQAGRSDTFDDTHNFLIQHALLWSGTSTAVDLHPVAYKGSEALGLSGLRVVGRATDNTGIDHPAIWTNGTQGGFLDLTPSGFQGGLVWATDGTTQAGSTQPTGNPSALHAALWSSTTAASFVDLHNSLPAGFALSEVYAVLGANQVGYADTPSGAEHAILWSGVSHTVTDLNQFLPAGYTDAYATGFGANGSIFGTATTTDGHSHAIAWVVPEPTVLPVLSLLALGVRRRRRSNASV
jgi:MYXO-CTERM domain-containing protein